ncbi:hypothetical protein [Maribacter cobaltidurans]|uniref:hypothetical protein n=1 Tax=Maribacter cobaltidurans TaxID=1178778 RepID=UPI0013153279|nr:hypothetical protein [Maribacter cobaltidurans]
MSHTNVDESPSRNAEKASFKMSMDLWILGPNWNHLTRFDRYTFYGIKVNSANLI